MNIKKRLKNDDAFCVLPWIEDYTEIDGKKYFCCRSNIEIDSPDSVASDIIRNKIWENEKVNHCNSCYELENKSIISPRQIESSRWLKDSEIVSLFLTESSPKFNKKFIDLRLNNKCNLACIMCEPKYSSLWEKELKILPLSINDNNSCFTGDMSTVKKIYVAGGEPLINDNFKDLLTACIKTNPHVELIVNTNLTSISDIIIEKLQKLSDVTFMVSVDSYGKVNEYHRYPLKWSKFLKNLEIIKNHTKIKIAFNTVASAISVFGFSRLTEIDKYPLSWNLTILTTPLTLMLNNIPDKLKLIAIENAEALKNSIFYKTDVAFNSQINGIIDNIKAPGDPKILRNYIKELDARRKINHENYLGVNLIEAA